MAANKAPCGRVGCRAEYFFGWDRIIFTGKRNAVETPKITSVKIIQSPTQRKKIKSVSRIDNKKGTSYKVQLSQYYDQFDQKVQERTTELLDANVELQKAKEQVHFLSRELIKVQEIERQQISLDLLDNVAQQLSSLKVAGESYRLVQVALNNIQNHAHANRVDIKLLSSHPNIILRIKDDGQGFDLEEAFRKARQNKRLGLLGMQERVRMVNGTFKIHSTPLEGTKIIITIPLDRDNAGKEENTDC
jgi:signal transduction histidine kinase